LASEFSSVEDLRAAERLIDRKIAAFVKGCEGDIGPDNA
jgi:hypothetical protein